jgi:hypothetical protein
LRRHFEILRQLPLAAVFISRHFRQIRFRRAETTLSAPFSMITPLRRHFQPCRLMMMLIAIDAFTPPCCHHHLAISHAAFAIFFDVTGLFLAID